MEEYGEKRHGEEVDWISNFPDSLVFQVLLNLPTKDVVKTSVLSSRWKNLWRHVPGLDLTRTDFTDGNTFLSFVDDFLSFNESRLQSFKLSYSLVKCEVVHLTPWINTLVERRIQHLDLEDELALCEEVEFPLTFYTCESLVSLKLSGLNLATPKFVSLPSLKVMKLTRVCFDDDLAFETLISGCPVLESLDIERSCCDETQVLRVCSQSLLSFTHAADGSENSDEDLVVVIDAPRLEYLLLSDYRIANFILKNLSSLVEADIDTVFNFILKRKFDPNDLQKRSMIRNFLLGISSVKHISITLNTLEVIYNYSTCETLPLFRNLSSLRVDFDDYRWEMLPIFLESCPNLKSLVVGSTEYNYPKEEGISMISRPRCHLSSLEYVEIERQFKGEATEMKLVRYLLEKSTVLKKLTLCLDDSVKKDESVILTELRTISRLSTSCQVVVRQ